MYAQLVQRCLFYGGFWLFVLWFAPVNYGEGSKAYFVDKIILLHSIEIGCNLSL